MRTNYEIHFPKPAVPSIRGILNLQDYLYSIACQASLTSKVEGQARTSWSF